MDPAASTNAPAEEFVVLHPPTEDPSPQTLTHTVILMVCFTMGIAGNASQLALQLYTRRFSRSNKTEHSQVVIENLVDMWMFGMFTCASHFILITAGRAVIGWILVFIVIDQMLFSEIWKGLKRINLRCAFYFSLAFLLIFAVLIVTPSLFYIKVIVYEEYGKIANFRIDTYRCSTVLPRNVSLFMNAFALAFDYLLPVFLVFVLLTVYLSKVGARHRGSPHHNQWKINLIIILLTVIHFLSYLPHWSAILLLFSAENWSLQIPDWTLQLLQPLVLLVPHLSAAFAWIPLSTLSTLIAERSRSLCAESYSYGKLLPSKRRTTFLDESGNLSERIL